jgi:predicted RNA binding protein YcfA (HicA-like mRNA interferase family)
MSPKELERRLKKDGWQFLRHGKGSHRDYYHPEKDLYITIPWHQG